jgi:hypothetical protein
MAILASKGMMLKLSVASTFTTIAQLLSFDKDDMNAETFECDTLDNANAGIPYAPTGRTEGGSVSGDMFLDPALTIHKNLLTLLTTPATSSWEIVFSNTNATTWPFTGAGFSLAGPKAALKDGVKASFKIKLSGLPTFPA